MFFIKTVRDNLKTDYLKFLRVSQGSTIMKHLNEWISKRQCVTLSNCYLKVGQKYRNLCPHPQNKLFNGKTRSVVATVCALEHGTEAMALKFSLGDLHR
jgi:hypothetical protein